MIALGAAHSLFLTTNGEVFGCGNLSNGQLGIDPVNNKKFPYLKSYKLCKLQFPEPIRLISSGYFHGIAVSFTNQIYEWGENPQTLKMRTFIMKRLHLQNNSNKEQKLNSGEKVESENLEQKKRIPLKELSRDYMKIRRLCEWKDSEIVQISAGFNHSALVTANGKLFTWGKNLEMQLGHGNKKDRDEPTLMESEITKTVQWTYVQCARSYTTAVDNNGRVFVWGRNDKNQLGLGIIKDKTENGTSRKILLKASKEPKSLEIPNDFNNVQTPTLIPAFNRLELEQQISENLAKCDQLSISTISKFFVKNFLDEFLVAEVHLLAGDILHSLDVLVRLGWKHGILGQIDNNALSNESPKSPLSPPSSSLNSKNSESNLLSYNIQSGIIVSPRRLKSAVNLTSKSIHKDNVQKTKPIASVDIKNGNIKNLSNDNESSNVYSSQESTMNSKYQDNFFRILDKAWNLIRTHPLREIQTMALLIMLQNKFLVYHRLAADVRLCRLLDPYLEFSTSSYTSETQSLFSSSSQRQLVDMQPKERYVVLKSAKISSSTKLKTKRQKCDQLLASDRLRYYSECGHYEKCVVESGPAKQEFAALRNRLRKCTKCALRNRVS